MTEDLSNKSIEYLNAIGNYSNGKYEDGIMNPFLFKSCSPKILWILRETNGNFSPKDWWGNKSYKDSNPFDSKRQKGSKRHTWEPIAQICYQILNGKKANNDIELASAMERVAIINLKKTAGNAKINEKFYEYLKLQENRNIFIEQIKRINPDVIIGGNTLNFIKSDEMSFRQGRRICLNSFSDNSTSMKNNSCFCFLNKLFINPYHPSYVMNKDEYVKIVVAAYRNWLKIRNECSVFEW
ncbi:MAG: hypothetical protein IJP90_03345 [Treponema sp.]|nr:hypothetical protein [Treponema sp.]